MAGLLPSDLWKWDEGESKTQHSGRRSPDLERPNMSELSIVLVGMNDADKAAVGNFILQREAFEREPPPTPVEQQCERARGTMDGRRITVINTPNLMDPRQSHQKFSQHIESCVSLSAPGPHVFLLVLQIGTFTKEDRHRVRRALEALSEKAFEYTMVLIISEGSRKKFSIDDLAKKNNPLYQLIQECRRRYYLWKNKDKTSQVMELIINTVVKANGGSHLTCEVYKDAQSGIPPVPEYSLMVSEQRTEREKKSHPLFGGEQKMEKEEAGESNKSISLMKIVKQRNFSVKAPMVASREQDSKQLSNMPEGDSPTERLNLVLCGKRGAEKTSTGNAILGDYRSVSECQGRQGKVCGHLVTVVEMPALHNTQLSEEKVKHLTLRCISQCEPGVHAFLLVIPWGPLTDEDKGELDMILKTFTERIISYVMVLFAHDFSPTAEEVDFLAQNKVMQQLLQKCGNRFHIFNHSNTENNPHVSELLNKVKLMVTENTNSCFSPDMCLEAQFERRIRELEARHQTELEEKDRKIKELEDNVKSLSPGVKGKDESTDCAK
ncbi:hypothetical protein MATL_G00217070 [Megalops atlanticus]|uniref:AIG1-type G domain-containing protein n=1 Tax=Megalops atlanticus TaxID=7932 RepID=A0A9D3PH24_MEGAT|nr:hypothetical protein MATL_G00217070 [Megalops atlanticus]